MRKYFMIYFLSNLALITAGSIIAVILSQIVASIVLAVNNHNFDFHRFVVTVNICDAIVVVILVIAQNYFLNSFYGHDRGIARYEFKKGKSEDILINHCVAKLKENKEISSVFMIVAFIAISAVFFIVGVWLFYVGKNAVLSALTNEKESFWEENIIIVACLFLINSTLQVFTRIIFVLRRTCLKCGCFYSFVENDSKIDSYDYEEERTVNKDVKIGEVKIKKTGEKVGNVYKSVNENQSRTVKGYTTTTYYTCVFCGHKAKEKQVDEFVSKWD